MKRTFIILLTGIGLSVNLTGQEGIQSLTALDRNSLEGIVLPSKSYFQVDPSNYLQKHDIVYKSPMLGGFEGFPQGNGDMGGMIWTIDEGIVIQVNKSNIYDVPNDESSVNLRSAGQLKLLLGAPVFKWLFLEDFDARLSLNDASVNIHSETPFMSAEIKSYVCADRNLWMLDGRILRRVIILTIMLPGSRAGGRN